MQRAIKETVIIARAFDAVALDGAHVSQNVVAKRLNESAPRWCVDSTFRMMQRECHAMRTRVRRGNHSDEDALSPYEPVGIAPANCAENMAQEVGKAMREPGLAGVQTLEPIVDEAGQGLSPRASG